MKYRITKVYERDKQTKNVVEYYQVEYLGYGWTGLPLLISKKWKPLSYYDSNSMYSVEYMYRFDTLCDAEKVVTNLLKPVHLKEVVKTFI